MKYKFNKKELELVTDLLRYRVTHPNYYSGTGRFSKKSADHAQTLVNALVNVGLVEGKHFKTGNDSARQGHSGRYVRLLAAGYELAVFKHIKETLIES